MGTCELCGALKVNLKKIKTNGTELMVCQNCIGLGIVIEDPKKDHSFTFQKRKRIDISQEELIDDYNKKIQIGMQKKGIDLHQLAKAVNIKESQLSKFLSKKLKPDLNTAKKIQNFLDIDLINLNDMEEKDFILDENTNSSYSLGDLIKKELNK